LQQAAELVCVISELNLWVTSMNEGTEDVHKPFLFGCSINNMTIIAIAMSLLSLYMSSMPVSPNPE